MIQAFYTSATGMSVQQKNMDVISNNISNVNTPGYRIKRAEFSELLDLEFGGYGVKVSSVSTMPFPNDVNPLKMAVYGQGGYFVLEDNSGKRFYSSSGDFKLLEQNGSFYLATEDDKFVLDNNYNRIEMTNNDEEAIVNQGYLYPDGNLEGEGVRIAVVRFENNEMLTMSGNGVFEESALSGRPAPHDFAKAVSDYSDELSPIVMEQQMGETMKIIQAQMAYSFNSKVLQVADDMAAMANHLRY